MSKILAAIFALISSIMMFLLMASDQGVPSDIIGVWMMALASYLLLLEKTNDK